ncbi:MAG: CRISPR-associated endonuclease Cas1 [Proteobacteria bacterium]|nr:CRISPR-associated endonuclease Cas1 [Pseudomonadota bacterium]
MRQGLFEHFISKTNFLEAFARVAAKGALGGVDGVSLEKFRRNLSSNLMRLRQDIQEGRYKPQPVKSVWVPKLNPNGEWRELGLPTVVDKVAQAALLNVVEPLAENIFLSTSYGYRRGKGPMKALQRVEHNLKNLKLIWVSHHDVDNCFDSLDQNHVIELFSGLVEGDARLVELVALWSRMGVIDPKGQWRNVEAGVRQGQILSPLLANLYLHPLDELAVKGGWGWVRYADNFLIQCSSQAKAVEAEEKVRHFLETSLGLKLNPNPDPVASLKEGFVFLGILFKGQQREIAPEKIEKIKNRLRFLLSARNQAPPRELLSELGRRVDGWRRYYGFLNPKGQFAYLDKIIADGLNQHIQRRVRDGAWSERVPDELMLPSLRNINPAKSRQALKKLWSAASNNQTDVFDHRVQKKVQSQHLRYSRKLALEGEVFVSTPGSFLGCRGERLVLRQKGAVKADVPLLRIRGICIASPGVTISSNLIELCARKSVTVYFLDQMGKVTGLLSPPGGHRSDLSLAQLKHRETSLGRLLACQFIWGKLKNQRALLRYNIKNHARHGESAALSLCRETVKAMGDYIDQVKNISKSNSPENFRARLLGLEGACASRYWRAAGALLPSDAGFNGRNRRGAKDLVNSILNYGYGILYVRMNTAVVRSGLNPEAGFLHANEPGRPSLVLDMVEEFRAPVVDRSVFALLKLKVKVGQDEQGHLTPETRRRVVQAVLQRLNAPTPYRGKKISLEEIMHRQGEALKNCLKGGRSYRAFLSRW